MQCASQILPQLCGASSIHLSEMTGIGNTCTIVYHDTARMAEDAQITIGAGGANLATFLHQ
jgi:hypothetical protein